MPRKTFFLLVILLSSIFSSSLYGMNVIYKMESVKAKTKSSTQTATQTIAFTSHAPGHNIDADWGNETVQIDKKVSAKKNEIAVPVLMYHHFQQGASEYTVVDPKVFREQMSYLKSKGYTTIKDHELISYLNGTGELPDNPVLITFDDGYESNYTLAYPVLKELDMKATIYIIGSAMREHRNDSTMHTYHTFLSWDQAKEMYDSGLIDIQHHTEDMHRKGRTTTGEEGMIYGPVEISDIMETDEQYEKRVSMDLQLLKQAIEQKIGNKVTTLCYPYGSYSEKSEMLAKKNGFQMTLTTKTGINSKEQGAYEIKRINVPGSYSGKDIVREIEKHRKTAKKA